MKLNLLYESHKTKIVISQRIQFPSLKGHPEINWSGFHVFLLVVGGKCVRTLRVFCSNFVDIFLRIICLLHVPPHTSFHLRSLQWQRRKHLFFGLRITSFLRLCFACAFGRPTADFVLSKSKNYDCCILLTKAERRFSNSHSSLDSWRHCTNTYLMWKAVKQSYVYTIFDKLFCFLVSKEVFEVQRLTRKIRNFTSLESLDFIMKMWKLCSIL